MFEQLFDQFKNLTPVLWAAEICGLVGWATLTASYQFPKKKFLIICSVAYFFFLCQQCLAALWGNVASTLLATLRNLLLLMYVLKDKEKMPDWINHVMCVVLILFTVFMLWVNDFTKASLFDYILPGFLFLFNTYTMNAKNYYVLKVGIFFNELGFMIYYAVNKLPFSILRQLILVVSVLVSIIIMILKDAKKKKEVPKIE